MTDLLRQVIAANRAGKAAAIPSVCSAHPQVLEASIRLAARLGRGLVIEATSNQVNQDGGYTGMVPADFVGFVAGIAERAGVDRSGHVLGGDHLGPQAWRQLPAEQAMDKAHACVAAFAAAGFTKLHLDCSEGCAGEAAQLPDEVTAERSAALALTALRAAPRPDALLFVIGTEVPPPGGSRVDEHGDIAPTRPEAARATLAAHAHAFAAAGVPRDLVGALVVQPGVEFSPMQVHRLPLSRDPGLLAALQDWPGLCLEAHSTDYQEEAAYPRLAELGFAFQKVGPALTFAWREALYALDALRSQAGWQEGEGLPAVMEAVMLSNPGSWQDHCRGTTAKPRVERHFGLADRIRYSWPDPKAIKAVNDLMNTLSDRNLPDAMLNSVFSTGEIAAARASGGPLPMALAQARVERALMPYFFDSQAGM